MKITDGGKTVTNEKGYRMAKASHGVWEGSWYFEAEKGEQGHARYKVVTRQWCQIVVLILMNRILESDGRRSVETCRHLADTISSATRFGTNLEVCFIVLLCSQIVPKDITRVMVSAIAMSSFMVEYQPSIRCWRRPWRDDKFTTTRRRDRRPD